MNVSNSNQPTEDGRNKQDTLTEDTATSAEIAGHQSKSMHDGVSVSCDCCSCEAEPYWQAIGEEMETDLSSHRAV